MKKQFLIIGMTLAMIAIGLSGCTEEDKLEEDSLNDLNYSNEEFGFGLNPPEGWTISEDYVYGVSVLFYGPMEDGPPNLEISVPTMLGSGETLQSTAEESIEMYDGIYVNFSLISSNAITINSMNAYEFVYTLEDVFSSKEKMIFVETNSGTFFKIHFVATQTAYDTYVSIVDQSISSFTMI